ncbi:MAG TPA: hypothetical protein VEA37_01805, partial [Flavobacterium sp.]|nr:hypothetical protein [Flavobacterium sp.]
MNNKYLLLLLVSVLGFNGFAQAPGCPAVNVTPGIPLCEPGDCTTITADYFETGETTSYEVSSIPYSPPYSFTGGTPLVVAGDDYWATQFVTLPFDFCFFGETYNKVLIGSNGLVTFSIAGEVTGGLYAPNDGCAWQFDNPIPNSVDPAPQRNCIFGVFQDTDPTNGGDPSITWQVLGSYPCRTFVFNVTELGQFSCGDDNGTNTSQMVLYETTNVIEVYVHKRNPCLTWNGGNGLIGIQNQAGTEAYFPENRNTGNWSASNEAWRFTPNGPSNIEFEWLIGDAQFGTDLEMMVCPTVTTTYTARATYTLCNGDEVIKEADLVVVVPDEMPINEPEDVMMCGSAASYPVNLTAQNAYILNGLDPNVYQLGLHLSEENAVEGYPPMNNATATNFTVNAGEDITIWVRIEDFFSGCSTVTSFVVSAGSSPDIGQPLNMQVCDLDEDGENTFDLTSNDGTVLAGQDPNNFTVTYHTTLENANNNVVDITTPEAFTSAGQTIFARVTGIDSEDCFAVTSFDLVVTPIPDVEAPEDVFVCSDTGYILPALASGNYYTLAGGPDTPGQGSYDAGAVVSTSQTIYVFHESGSAPNNCIDEDSFVVTVYEQPEVDTPADVAACDSYVLPVLSEGTYYTEAGGQGDVVAAGTEVTATQTFYIYAQNGTAGEILC